MSKKEFFLFIGFLLMGLAVWFFPKSIDQVLFLGFSNPVVIGHADRDQGEDQQERETASLKRSGTKAHLSTKD